MADLHPIVEQLRFRGQLAIIPDNAIPSDIPTHHRLALKRFSRSFTAVEKVKKGGNNSAKLDNISRIQTETLVQLHEAGLLTVNFVLQTAVDEGLLPNPDTGCVAVKRNGNYVCWQCGEALAVDLPPFAARQANIHKVKVICPQCRYGE